VYYKISLLRSIVDHKRIIRQSPAPCAWSYTVTGIAPVIHLQPIARFGRNLSLRPDYQKFIYIDTGINNNIIGIAMRDLLSIKLDLRTINYL